MRKIVISDELRRIAEEHRAAGRGGAVGLSEAAGLPKTAVRDAIRTGNPTIRTLVPLADYLNVPLEQLIFGTESRPLEIPVVGIVAAGDGWMNTDDAGHEPLEFHLAGHDLIAIEIRGNSMFPVYRDGDFLVCARQRGPSVDDLVGRDCAVLTRDGKGYVKQVLKGTRVGRYNLKSYNLAFSEIIDAEIEWAAPVQWVRRKQ